MYSFLAADIRFDMGDMGMTMLLIGLVTVIANAAIIFGRLYNAEVQERTLSTLIMLPCSTKSLALRSTLGILPSIVASGSCLLCGLTMLLMANERITPFESNNWFIEPWFYQAVVWAAATVHLGLLLSIRLRYGGMLLAIVGLWIVFPLMMGNCINVLSMGFNGPGTEFYFRYVFPLKLILITVPFCVWLHFRILRTLETVAEQA